MIQPFNVQVLKRDLKDHYSWKTNLLFHDTENEFWVTINSAPRSLNHQTKGEIYEFETHSMEWFWENIPFSVGLALHPITEQVNYYCNIHEPFRVQDNCLTFIDLDLDVVKNIRHPSATIVDQDEFIVHSEKYQYPNEFSSLIPDISYELQNRLEQHDIFKRDHVIEAFQVAQTSKEQKSLLDPSQHFESMRNYLKEHPWPSELFIPPSLCKSIQDKRS